jgi:hypothetical protein
MQAEIVEVVLSRTPRRPGPLLDPCVAAALVVRSAGHIVVVFDCAPPTFAHSASTVAGGLCGVRDTRPLSPSLRAGRAAAHECRAEADLHARVAGAVRRARENRLVVIAGHGHGGGVAQLFVRRFFSPIRTDQLFHPLQELHTFGGPAVGDAQFNRDLDGCGQTDWTCFRIVLHTDARRTTLQEDRPARLHTGVLCYIPCKPQPRGLARFIVLPTRAERARDWLRSKWTQVTEYGKWDAGAATAAEYALALVPI